MIYNYKMVQFSLSFIPEPSWSFSISLMIAWKTSLTDYKTNIHFYHKMLSKKMAQDTQRVQERYKNTNKIYNYSNFCSLFLWPSVLDHKQWVTVAPVICKNVNSRVFYDIFDAAYFVLNVSLGEFISMIFKALFPHTREDWK